MATPPTTTTTAPPPSGPTDFASLSAQTLNGGGGAASGYNDPQDPTVLVHKKERVRIGHDFYSQDEQRKPQSDLLKQLYGLQGPELRALQERLWKGGFYGNVKRSQVGWGQQADDATVQAYTAAIGKAANINSSEPGKNTTLDEVIDTSKQTDAQGGGGQSTQKALTNPDEIKALVQSVAPSVLGRRAPDDVVQKIVDTLRSSENTAQDQANAGNPVVDQAPSGNQGWFEEQLRQLMPNAVKSNEIFKGLSAAQNNLGAPVAQLYHG